LTLYISDLDGTLLGDQQNISERSCEILSRLIGIGLPFTIATARSWESAKPLIESLPLKLPLILNNGACLFDPLTKTFISILSMGHKLTTDLVKDMAADGVNSFVFTDLPERTVFHGSLTNQGESHYYDARMACGDLRFIEKDNIPSSGFGAIAIISIGYKEVLEPLKESLEKKYEAAFHLSTDIYSEFAWLEIQHKDVSKGSAVKSLRRTLGADKTVCFGDHLNDLSMFRVCDEGIAMGNAQDELKQVATRVIGVNTEDVVAEYLKRVF